MLAVDIALELANAARLPPNGGPSGDHLHGGNGVGGGTQGVDELYVAQKGGKDKGKGGKGYGQCWECGEWGHPRRECPKFLARVNNKGSGDVAALNGGGKKGKGGKGKWWKGSKGRWNGKGKGNYHNYNKYARSFGKAIGKGLNNFNYDYQEAWGDDLSGGWGNRGGEDDDWWSENWQKGNGMDVMMMFENGNECSTKNEGEKGSTVKNAKATGAHDKLTNTERVKPIKLQNSYSVFQFEAESDDDSDGDEDEEIANNNRTNAHMHNWTDDSESEQNMHKWTKITKHKPNKRQRQRQTEMRMNMQRHKLCDEFEGDERAGAAAASQIVHENDWIGISEHKFTKSCACNAHNRFHTTEQPRQQLRLQQRSQPHDNTTTTRQTQHANRYNRDGDGVDKTARHMCQYTSIRSQPTHNARPHIQCTTTQCTITQHDTTMHKHPHTDTHTHKHTHTNALTQAHTHKHTHTRYNNDTTPKQK